MKQNIEPEYFELDYLGLVDGKKRIRYLSSKKSFYYPSYSAVLDKRWKALINKWNISDNVTDISSKRGLKITTPQLLKILLDICAEQNLVAEQREIYYAVRGKYPDLNVEGKEWKELYNTFLNNYINKVQLMVKIPMQSFGVEAGSRGSVAGEGFLLLEDGKKVQLDAEPKLRFELTRDKVRYTGRARKHIHYEKEAGFARLIAGNISQMIEAIFSTSQGYATEAASKFLRDSEERGIQTYCIHDADPHGLQMQMMYGVSSKNNCYMTDRFYPHNVIYLGLVPVVARAINLPPETVSDNDRKILPNLRQLLKEKGEFLNDVDIIDKHNQKWEYQALNAMHERAPQIYMVESLRARNDEIKYVPPATEIKKTINKSITTDVQNFTEEKINNLADNFYHKNIKPQLVEQLKEKLEADISDFNDMMIEELPKLDDISDSEIREAIKLKLIDNPRQFWNNAQYQVASSMLYQKFDIDADIEFNTSVKTVKTTKELEIKNPKIADHYLTKTDIVNAIERRIITTGPARDKVVNPMRNALEQSFGKPNEEW